LAQAFSAFKQLGTMKHYKHLFLINEEMFFFFWRNSPRQRLNTAERTAAQDGIKKDHRNMYFTYKQQEFNRNLEGSKGVCRALSRVEKNVKRQLDEAQCTRRRRLGFALLSRLSMPISTCPP